MMPVRSILFALLTALLFAQCAVAAQVKVDEPAVCFVCHAETEIEMNKTVRHPAFELGVCSDCHNPHASSHAGLVKKEIEELCLTCHTGMVQELALPSIHQPAADGKCLDCHHPHASEVKYQLLAPAFDLCVGCHQNVKEWTSQAQVHKPVAEKKCQSCHAPHGSAHDRLLTDDIPKLCFGCHDQNQAFAAAHEGYNLSQANCVTCHDAHASSDDHLLMANQHSPFKSGKCELCHATQSGASAFALIGTVQTVCGKCHQAPLRDAEKKYSHNMHDDRSCLNCHNSHASSTVSLLSANQNDLCMRCHFSGDEFKDKPKEAYLTHDSIGCSACHTPHGSDNDQYLTSLDLDLCTGCHVDAHSASHPIGPGVIDKRTGSPLTCLSCHKMHGADFDKYLPLDPAMDLCLQCHRK